MERIWMVVSPSKRETRLLATDGPHKTLLKARLAPRLVHPRALETLLEAVALWQGLKVHAVLAADVEASSYAISPGLDLFEYKETALYTLDLAPIPRRRRRDGAIFGMGDFRDLYAVLRREVAR